jgi:ubiquitin carboxyl-terminal hydrolase 8
MSTEKIKGLSGLSNMGNTCYMNSVIQCLSNNLKMTKFFLDYEKKLKESKDGKKYEDFLMCYIILIREMWRENTVLKPTSLKKSINYNYPKYNNKKQHDAHELLLDILDMLHHSTHKKSLEFISDNSSSHYIKSRKAWKAVFNNKNSYISDNFFGQMRKKFKCNVCQQSFYIYEPFSCLFLNLPNNSQYTISNLIKHNFKPDYINVICKRECNEYCIDEEDKTNPEHKVSEKFFKLPETLILVIKRYNKNNIKIRSELTIEEQINIEDYCITNTEESVVYTLKSVIFHDGDTTDSGHYFSVVKYKTGYKVFDDTKIFGINDINTIDNTSSYILFYERMMLKK